MVAEIKVGVGPRTLLLVEPRGTLSGSAQEAIVLDRGGDVHMICSFLKEDTLDESND